MTLKQAWRPAASARGLMLVRARTARGTGTGPWPSSSCWCTRYLAAVAGMAVGSPGSPPDVWDPEPGASSFSRRK